MALSPDGKFIYVAPSFSGSVVETIDTATDTLITPSISLSKPSQLQELDVSSDGKYVFTADRNGGTAIIIDTAKRQEIIRVPTGTSPVEVLFAPTP